jgi:nitrile hydratase subunit beta
VVVRKTKSAIKCFVPGDTIDSRAAVGHCRTPWYLRGKTGTIAQVQGIFRDAEKLAYHKPGQPKLTLYKVRFKQRDIWPNYTGPANDTLESDIYEHWLRPVAPAPRRKTAKSGAKS